MQRIGFLLKVKQEKIEEYKIHHAAVWPEMLDALSRHGWRNYSLFLTDDGLLFGYLEATESLAKSLAGMSKEDVNRRWQADMKPYFEEMKGRADEALERLEQVFYLE